MKIRQLLKRTTRIFTQYKKIDEFDPDFYKCAYPDLNHLDALALEKHYVRHGEAEGRSPNREHFFRSLVREFGNLPDDFNPKQYRMMHKDLRESDFSDELAAEHYLRYGRAEKRPYKSGTIDDIEFPTNMVDPARENVMVLVHEASRSGAPILAWNIVVELQKIYNVVVVIKCHGPIEKAFYDSAAATICLDDQFFVDDDKIEAVVERLIRVYAPKYVIANSVETRLFVPFFENKSTPVVALVHEFSSYIRPIGTLNSLFEYASHIVFPAKLVAEAAMKDYKVLALRNVSVLAQGVPNLPVIDAGKNLEAEPNGVGPEINLKQDGHVLLVVGMGSIELRKGVDIFISTAAIVRGMSPDLPIRFVWVGKALPHELYYFEFLKEQVSRSDLAEIVAFIGELDDLEPVFAQADIMFLPSRLDPLPNTAINAASKGVPIICFDQASGIAEILKENADTRHCVAPYLDPQAAAQLICDLVVRPERRAALSKAVQDLAETCFNMENYVQKIDALAKTLLAQLQDIEADYKTILEHAAFKANLYLGYAVEKQSVGEALMKYLRASRRARPRARPRAGLLVRRPLEGFHPLIYTAENPEFDESTGEDPLAHFLRNDRPPGPWAHPVIVPSVGASYSKSTLNVAVHGHFHYPDLIPDFVRRLKKNATPVDFFVTTTSSVKAAEICKLLATSGIDRSMVIVVPNRGRDIGPMLSELGEKLLSGYEIVGHFHGKRTPQFEAQVGERWRNFIWEHLVGDEIPMMDAVLAEFEADDDLGLVFPEDPHLSDWDENLPCAEELAQRMGVPLPLPRHIEFSHGTMFWARPDALRPLFELALSPSDFPEEPLPGDGTILHALERLLTFSSSKAGYRYATTHVECWQR